MYTHRAIYAVLTLGMCGLIYGGAYWLYQENLTNPKTVEDFFLTYKVAYDYGRYTGNSRLVSLENAFTHTQVQAAPATGYAASIPVLMYHRINSGNDPYNVTPAAFKAQMFALKNAGYTTVSAEDYADFMAGTKKLPTKSVLITFDDGTKDSYYPVQPILKALDFRATNFIITRYSIEDFAGSHYYLSEVELKAMERTGNWDLEVHTKDGHSYYPINASGKLGEFYPNKLWLPAKHRMETDPEYAARVYNDMATAKRQIQNFTHKPANLFAFPFADIGENHTSNYASAPAILTRDVQHLFKATMQLYYPGRSQSQGYYNSKAVYTYRIQLKLGDWPDGQGLVSFLQNGAAKPLPYADDLQTDHGWQDAWGQSEINNHTLTIKGNKDSTGAGVLLDGTSAWSNYTMTAQATLTKGQSYGFLARMRGESYRIGCYFGNNYVSVTRNQNNVSTVLGDRDYTLPVVSHTENLGVRVKGNRIECLQNGTVILSLTDPVMPATGGVGFSVWNPATPSLLTIKNIKVTPS